MKTNKTLYTIAVLISILMVGCTKNFEDYNRDPYGATADEITRIPFGGNELTNLITWVVPNQENGFQMSFSMPAGTYSGYSAMTGLIEDYPKYNPRSGWVSYPYSDTYKEHLYKFFRPLSNKANGDLNEPYYALSVVLRAAITHWVSDFYGPLPYSKIKDGNLTSPYDTQQELYTSMLKDLKDASMSLDKIPSDYRKYKDYDAVYYGDMKKWADYARSLILRMSIRISKVAPEMAKEYAEWAVANGVITKNADNAQMASIDNPLFKIEDNWADARVGADIVEYLKAYKDPRLSKMIKPGAGGMYIGLRSPETGIKKDASLRANYSTTNITKQSPMVWISAAEVAFLKAEAKLLGWNVGAESAKDLYEAGVKLSFEQWNAGDVTEYLKVTDKRGAYNDPYISSHSMPFSSAVTVNWDSANGDIEAEKAMIITQKWIALFPFNTVEAWAEWRRTGYPNLLPAVANASGNVVLDIYQENGRDRGGMRRLTFPNQEYSQNKEGLAIGIQDLGGKDSYATDLWWAK